MATKEKSEKPEKHEKPEIGSTSRGDEESDGGVRPVGGFTGESVAPQMRYFINAEIVRRRSMLDPVTVDENGNEVALTALHQQGISPADFATMVRSTTDKKLSGARDASTVLNGLYDVAAMVLAAIEGCEQQR